MQCKIKDRPHTRTYPEYYVLLCARRDAETVRRLTTARTNDKQRKAKERLSHIRVKEM